MTEKPPLGDIRAASWLLMLLIAAVFLMGGSARDDVSSLLILRPLTAVIFAAAFVVCLPEAWRRARALTVIGGCILLLPVIHLVPLPPALWTALPGRAVMVDIYHAAGIPLPWHALSLTPEHSWNALFFLLAPLSAFLLAITLPTTQLRQILSVVLLLSLLSGLLGCAQLIGVSFYPYAITNQGSAVGLFANRNHAGLLLACLLPLLALYARTASRRRNNLQFIRVMAVAVSLFLIPMILITGSRAALICAAFAIPMASWIYGRDPSGGAGGLAMKFLSLFALLAAACLGALFFLYSRAPALARLYDTNAEVDLRWRAAPTIWQAVRDYLPWGSGLGSFVEIYKLYEPRALLGLSYLNHAHNDWLELLLTGGLPAALLLAAAILVLLYQTVGGLASEGKAQPWARAGLSLVILFAVASLVDYPLRTPALSVLLALAVVFATRRDSPRPASDRP